MRACTTANAIVLGLSLAALTFAACSGSSTTQTSQTPTDTTESQTGAPSEGAATDSPAATGDGEQAAATPAPKKQPETVADCKELKTDITNEPPSSAVAMNNATAPDGGDGGTSDRLQPMVDLMRANRDKFRCCFDLWARKNPGAAGRVTLKVKLDPNGTLGSSEIGKDTSVAAPEVHACILEVAKSLTYPKSPSGKETTYTHPFDFKARH
jgi:hypothetical protein